MKAFLPGLGILQTTLYFFRKHLPAVLLLGLIAAMGRVIQLKGFGPISPALNVILEIVVEIARIYLLLFVLGLANVQRGIKKIRNAFSSKQKFRMLSSTALHKLKKNWVAMVFNTAAFLGIAWAINYLIDLTAYETCFYLNLTKNGILAETSSEWTILLFLKNLTVIPLTIIFDCVLILWLLNQSAVLRRLNPA